MLMNKQIFFSPPDFNASRFLSFFSRSERDDFIRVNWDNIKERARFNFKQFTAHVSMFSTPYDYGR